MMVNVEIRMEASFDPEELPNVYLNEDILTDAIKEAISSALERLDAQNITFSSVDVEGLE
jgi:uncharacterized protein (UPF0212 family)